VLLKKIFSRVNPAELTADEQIAAGYWQRKN